MNDSAKADDFLSIKFEGHDLPVSFMGISILLSMSGLSEESRDWIWKLRQCCGIKMGGPSEWCRDSAAELSDFILDRRDEVVALIGDRLGVLGIEPEATMAEWIESMQVICDIAAKNNGKCTWIAKLPDIDPESLSTEARRMLAWMDEQSALCDDDKESGHQSPTISE